MDLFFFIYTLTLLFVCILTASICGAAYAVSHRKRYIPQALFFIFYFIELSSIFGSEWLIQNISNIGPNNYYAIDNPVFRTIVGAAILLCFWHVVLEIIDAFTRRTILIPTIIYIGCCAAVLLFLPYGALRQWLFYTMRQLSLALCLIYAFVFCWRKNNSVMRQRITKRLRSVLIITFFIICIVFEDTLVILILPIPGEHSIFAPLFLSSRNFSENAMMLYLAYSVIRPAFDILLLHFNEPPDLGEDNHEVQLLNEHIQDRLPRYAANHGLSKRESEILDLVIQGRNNREIATTLILAEGTVKTHLHNITKKCHQTSREDLRKDFWSS